MHILCPHCHNPIELLKITSREEVLCPSCGSSFRLEGESTTGLNTAIGQKLGRFELLEEVGQGAFGTVYKALDRGLDRTVAVKVPRAGNLPGGQDLDRFLREARSAAQLRHPSIVSVHEVGQADGLPYLVSDFVHGVTLADLLTARRPALQESARLIAAVADALQYAHERGVIHRDVKPSNIMLTEEGSPHLMDFGLAKRAAGEITMTLDGQVLGTPAYMSPEQAKGEAHAVDGRSDVYSLGVVLYQLLTGELPFRGNARMLLHQVLHEEPRSPRRLNDRIPRDLETITLKAMAKEPGRRYATAGALADDLRRFLQGESIRARPTGSLERSWRWARRRPAVAALLALVLLVTALGVGGIVWKWQDALAAEQLARAAEEKERARAGAEEEARRQAVQAQRQERKAKERALAERDNKERALVRADGLRLAAEASAARYADPGLSLLLAIEGVRRAPNHLTYNPLYEAVADCREQRTLVNHHNQVHFVRYSPDGRFVLAAGDPDISPGQQDAASARLYDAATGKQVAVWPGYRMSIGALDWSPDGRQVAAALTEWQLVQYRDGRKPEQQVFTDRVVYVWDAATGKDLVHIGRHADRVVSVRYSPDGRKLVTASWDRTACIWDAATGKQLRVLTGHECSLLMACFSPDGRRVLTLSSSITDSSNYDHAWWLATDKGPRPEVDPGVQHRRGVFFPGGDSHMSFSTTGEAKIVRIWDAETGAEVAALTKKRPGLFEFGHVWHPTRAAFSPNGRHVVVAFAEGVAAVWNAVTGGDEEVLLQGQDGAVQAAVFSPDGRRLATAGADRTVRMWDAATGKELPQLRGHQGAVRLVRFHPNGKLLLTTSEDRTARVWNVETGDEKAVFRGHTAEVRDASFSPDGRHVVTAGDTTARLWSVAPAPELGLVLKAHTAALSALAFSPDGKRLLTASRDGTVKLCDAATGRELLVLGKGQDLGPVRSAGFSADGRSVITAAETYLTALGDGRTGNASPVHLWDARTGKDRLALPGHETGASVATLSPDGRRLLTISEGHKRWKTGFATGSRSDSRWAGVVRLWDPATNRLVATLPGKGSSECVPMFSHDGRRLLVAFDNPTASRLFDAATGKELRAFSPAEQRWGRMVAVLSPDGQRVLTWTAGDNQTYTWDAQTGRLLARPQLLEAAVAFACFSPDSRRFAALAGRNAYVCDARTGQRVAVLRGHQAAAITAVFGPEGQRLLTGSADRTAVLWDVATSKVLALYKGHSGAVGLVAFSPSGRQIATGSTDGSVRLWPTDLLSAVLPRRPRELTEAEHERYEIPAPVVRKNGRAR